MFPWNTYTYLLSIQIRYDYTKFPRHSATNPSPNGSTFSETNGAGSWHLEKYKLLNEEVPEGEAATCVC